MKLRYRVGIALARVAASEEMKMKRRSANCGGRRSGKNFSKRESELQKEEQEEEDEIREREGRAQDQKKG